MRAQLRHNVIDGSGNVIQNASVYVYQTGTTTPIADTIYADPTSGTTLSNPLTSNNQGEIIGYLAVPGTDVPGYVDLLTTSNLGTAYFPSNPTQTFDFTSFTETVEVSADTPLPDIQVFNTAGSDTWTKPDGNYTWVELFAIGGGGGGGAGRTGATGTVRCGGGGGGGGAFKSTQVKFSDMGATEDVIVGAGGAGGAQGSASNQNGADGTNGSYSSVRFPTGGNLRIALVYADYGKKGSGGTATTGTGGEGGNGSLLGSPGASADTAGGAGEQGGADDFAYIANATNIGAAGGGAGGGIDVGNDGHDGGVGGTQWGNFNGGLGGDGGDGNAPYIGPTKAGVTPDGQASTGSNQTGAGGGGGAGTDGTGRGGAGAVGGLYGGGGGGGGAGVNTASSTRSGAGGAGAHGVVVIICY